MSASPRPADPKTKSIAIIGAGLTGLTAAHRLSRNGHRVRVFEKTGRVGGVIRTEMEHGWLIEAGPNTLLTGDPAVGNLLEELRITSACLPASPESKHRYIVRRGRPVPFPLSPPEFLTSSLFSPLTKLRMLAELASGRRVRVNDLSLEDLIRSHFGQQFVDYALNPFASGVYAGNPQKLSSRFAFPKLWELEQEYGSFLRGQRAVAKTRRARGEPPPGVVSFINGLHTLPQALADQLPLGTLSLNAPLEELVPGHRWSVIWHDGQVARTETFDAVIAALPASALASIRLGPLAERPLAGLQNIEHPPVTSFFLGYRREQISHPLDGFGLLVPAVERRSMLGVLFSSSLFPKRAPAGHVALTVLVGGTRQPEIAALSPEKLLARIRPDLRELLGVTGDPVFSHLTFWPRAIPQYNLGYERYVESMIICERLFPGLFIGGQARDGISMPACIAAGERLAASAVLPP
ncbi:MAG: protoporphyrinogen oxidase [Opitutaceae bacterium]